MTDAARTVGILVAVLLLVAGRLDDLDLGPVGFHLVRYYHRQAGARAGAHFGTVRDDGHGAVRVGDRLGAVRIDTLPAAGSLTLAGVAVTAGQVIQAADLGAGRLVFTPAPDANGTPYASITFTVRDAGGLYDATGHTLTLDVTAANDAPAISPGALGAIGEEVSID